MKDNCAVGCPAHASVRDTDHVSDALAQQLGGYRHVANFRHTGVPSRPTVLENHNGGFIDVKILVVNSSVKIVYVLEDYCATAMLQQVRAGRRRFEDRSVGRKISSQNRDAGLRFEWLSKSMNHLAIPAFCVLDIFPNGFPVGGQCVAVEHARLTQLSQYDRNTPSVVEVFHKMFARWLQINQTRQIGS